MLYNLDKVPVNEYDEGNLELLEEFGEDAELLEYDISLGRAF